MTKLQSAVTSYCVRTDSRVRPRRFAAELLDACFDATSVFTRKRTAGDMTAWIREGTA